MGAVRLGPVDRLSALTGLRRPIVGVTIVAFAFFLRGWRIDELPPGFLSDEAYNLVDIVEMLETGSHPLYFTRNNGREPLFLYLQAVSVAVLGATPFAARVVAVFLGTLTVALLYRLARELFGPGSWAPVVSSLVLAVTLYHAILSREGLRSISLPPLAVVALIALWSAYRRGQTRDFALAGLGFALALYTYVASRAMPLVPAGFLAAGWLGRWPLPRRWLPKAGLAAAIVLVGAAPLGYVAWRSPTAFWARSGVDLFVGAKGGVAGLAENGRRVAAMFFVRGDGWVGNNLPNRPIYDPALGFLFCLGLAVAVVTLAPPLRRRLRWPAEWEAISVLILLWLVAAILPVWLSVGAPSFLRSLNVAPPLAMLCALGAEGARQLVRGTWSGLAVFVVVAVSLAGGSASTVQALFWRWPAVLGDGGALGTDIMRLADHMKDGPPDRRYLVDASLDWHASLQLAMRSLPAQFIDLDEVLLTGPSAEYIVVEDASGSGRMSPWLPNTWGRQIGPAPSFTVGGAYWSFAFDEALPALPAKPLRPAPLLEMAIGEELRITGLGVVSGPDPASPVEVVLQWEVLRRPSEDYSVSLRIVDAAGQTVAQTDRRLGGAYLGTRSWLPGDVAHSRHLLRLPQLPSGQPHRIAAVVYFLGPPIKNLQLSDATGFHGELLDLGIYDLEGQR